MNAENIITINGRPLTFEPGETILEVAQRHGIFIPTLCHLPGAPPTGACRMCLVEVERARSLMAACTVPAAPNMVVHTDTPTVLSARRTVLELLLSSGNHNCSVRAEDPARWTELQQDAARYDGSSELCEVYGGCKLQALAYRYQVRTGALAGRKPAYPLEKASPLITRDFSRCILCGRCVQACNDIQVNNAISHGFRGAKAKIVAMGDHTIDRSDCVFCGQCIEACPVGALVDTRARYQARPWEVRHVRSTCSYCSVGCQVDLQVKDGVICRVAAVEGAQPNQGRLCAKGRFGFDFVRSPRRLTRPRIRKGDKLQDASWDEALDFVADKMKDAGAVAGVASARMTNESLYAFQKLVRAGAGTNDIATPFAANPMTHSLAGLEEAPCILLIGSDVTEENPVVGTFIKQAAKAGRPVIVVDNDETKILKAAAVGLKITEGTESVLISGMLKLLIDARPREGSIASEKITAAKRATENLTIERVLEMTGCARADLEKAAEILDGADSVMLLYGPKVAAYVPTFVILQDLLGNMTSETGGVNALGDLCNSSGAGLMGAHGELLPGYLPVSDGAARAKFEQAWQCSLSETAGRTFPQIMEAAAGGDVQVLLCAGENLALAQPVLDGTPAAIEKVDCLVVIDSLENETTAHAAVVLPAAAWGEEDGTYTNCERRISRVRAACEPAGEAWPAARIFAELARRLGKSGTDQVRELWDQEITSLVPQLTGISYPRIESDGVQWPEGKNLNGDRPVLLRPQWNSLNYHHRGLLEQCDGLLEALSESADAPPPAGDPETITRQFIELLEGEGRMEAKAEIDELLAAYRPRRGGLIPVLQKVQEILGFLPTTTQNYIALGLGLSAADVFGVVSFYSFFTMTPRGRNTIRVCLGTACYVKESGKILENLEEHLKIKVGETTEDREFTLTGVRCVGACGLAPVVVVGEETLGMVDPAKAATQIEKFRSTPDDS